MAHGVAGRTRARGRVRAAGLLVAAVVGIALGGCAAQLTTEVTAFNQVRDDGDAFTGRRFVIVPAEEQRGSLEFERYSDLVRRALVAKGMLDARDGATVTSAGPRPAADFDVGLRYGIASTGGAVLGSGGTGGFAIGSGGRGGISFGIGLGFPIGGGVGSASDGIRYRRELRVTIDRAPVAGTAPGAEARAFEGIAVSEGASASIAPVMPAMVRALFSEFPGKSGVTRRVQVPLEEEGTPPAR